MTREDAVRIATEKLKSVGIEEKVKISHNNWGEHGGRKCVYIETFPVKGNSELIKTLNTIPEFYGRRDGKNSPVFMYTGYLLI